MILQQIYDATSLFSKFRYESLLATSSEVQNWFNRYSVDNEALEGSGKYITGRVMTNQIIDFKLISIEKKLKGDILN